MKKGNAYMLLLIFAFMLFVAGSCDKKDDEPQLPEITQTGEGTLGCLVDGQIFIANPGFMQSPIGASNNQWEDKRWMVDGSGNDYTVALEICKDSIIEKISTLNGIPEESCSNGVIYFKGNSSQTALFTTSHSETGKIFITRFDTINRIISGTFYFDAVNSEGKITQVRDGRFDVKFMN